MNRGCCNECGYKADYIIDNNNFTDNGYKDLDQVPKDKMLCGACAVLRRTKMSEKQIIEELVLMITCDYWDLIPEHHQKIIEQRLQKLGL